MNVTITKEFAAKVKEQKSVEKDGIIYQYISAGEHHEEGFQWLDANHLNMMTLFDDRYSGICEIEE